jgi:hypothetical protein
LNLLKTILSKEKDPPPTVGEKGQALHFMRHHLCSVWMED